MKEEGLMSLANYGYNEWNKDNIMVQSEWIKKELT